VHSRTAANAKLYRIAASSDGAGSVKVRGVCVCVCVVLVSPCFHT
jgi:hypothetical protein